MAPVGHEDVLSVLRSVLALSRRLRDERAPGATTLAGVSILGALHRSGTVPSSRLAEAERLEPQSLTRQLADLEKRGFISRVRSELDKRAVLVSLTEDGHAALMQDLGRRRDWLEKAVQALLDESERQALFSAAPVMSKLARLASGGR